MFLGNCPPTPPLGQHFALTAHLGQNVGSGEGQVGRCFPETDNNPKISQNNYAYLIYLPVSISLSHSKERVKLLLPTLHQLRKSVTSHNHTTKVEQVCFYLDYHGADHFLNRINFFQSIKCNMNPLSLEPPSLHSNSQN